jgi:hypothetical protein
VNHAADGRTYTEVAQDSTDQSVRLSRGLAVNNGTPSLLELGDPLWVICQSIEPAGTTHWHGGQ